MLPPCVNGIEYIYNVTTALFCHRLLEMYFRNESAVLWDPVFNSSNYRFVSNSANRAFPAGYSLVPEIDNATNVAMVCTGLSADDCRRWVSCSRAARDCCERQKAAQVLGSDTESQCSITWDGISCVDATPNGTILDLPCPSYYIPTGESETFSMECLPNGEWKEHIVENGTLSAYSVCKKEKAVIGRESLELEILVTLITNLISLAFILPSLAILTFFKLSGNTESPGRMHRMFRIHQHFLVSLILVSVVTLLWDEVIVKEHITKLHKESSQIDLNSPFCKAMHIAQRYLRSTTYFWMFVEGLSIFMPLLPNFKKEISLPWLCFVGWGIPLILTVIYASLRTAISRYDYKCWIYAFLELEFIIIGPNVIPVLCNTVFLIIIVATIVRKSRDMRTPHTSHSVLPKPLRSLIFLVPLFGSHFVLAWVLYVFEGTWSLVVIRVVEGLQGALVSIMWVFCSKKVLVTLRYLAKGDFFSEVGDIHGVSKSSVCRIIHSVCSAINTRTDNIKFPTDANGLGRIKEEFYKVAHFPSVVGAIDGTLIPIQGMSGDSEAAFVCRKGFHAINVQAVVDANMKFLNINARYPGATHDAYILANSNVSTVLDAQVQAGWLLRDSGYPLKDWLLTPFMNPADRRQAAYNNAHCKTRNIIERAFGVVKSRFRCLHQTGGCLPFSPLKCSRIIETCFRLHNLAVDERVPLRQGGQVYNMHHNIVFHGQVPPSEQQKIMQVIRDVFRRAMEQRCPHIYARFRGRKFSMSSHTHLTQVMQPAHANPIVYNVNSQRTELQRLSPVET